MKERAKALLRKNKNELPAARTLYVSLDNADNIIEGGQPFRVFSVDEISRSDYSTAIRQRRVTGLGFPGARLFQPLEGSGF
jgi:hypothetical protein